MFIWTWGSKYKTIKKLSGRKEEVMVKEKDLAWLLLFGVLMIGGFLLKSKVFPSSNIFPTKEEVETLKNPPKPYATPYEPLEAFTTLSIVSSVENSPAWYVIVERKSNGTRIPAKVEPYRQIAIGTVVKLSRMHWETTSAQRMGPDCNNYPFIN